ncbi:hypothetical protein [Polyangium sp. 6x1]|uniref:hypothetical protein n=1 Tax=Polyangium sp. 6x1 TaxID=3042689 RepID=UPI002482E4FE|nr:hypothetical protein [Polyangium sp. 6x1]MDI1444018.1 hypothetical protein [Polyangium sp. 6x1]
MLNPKLVPAPLLLSLCGALASSCSTPDPAEPPPPACTPYDTSVPKPLPGPFTVVHVEPGTPPPVALALQACAGLHNRSAGGSVYIDADPHDMTWLNDLGAVPTATLDAQQFLDSCAATFPACVRYDYKSQQSLLPNILTVAAALGAVPVDGSLNILCDNPAFDAIAEFSDKNTPALATKYVFDTYAKQTTGLAMLNPGYEPDPQDNASPAMTQEMKPALVDFVFSQRLFVVFLVNGCVDGNPEKELLSSIVNAGNWATPLGVYGYNNSWNVAGGYLYEAQTLCLDSRNMGAVASEAGNLSFFTTRTPPITGSGAVVQNEPESLTYDPNKTYVAFVVGDGDNIQYLMTTRHDWFQQRIADCEAKPDACPPLTWSISPHLTSLAPDLLGWYYEQSHRTGKDYFVLPPSGHLYAYPSSLAESEQDVFVKATQEDACILGLTGVVHWDWLGTWHDAEDHFLPKYATAGGSIRGVFPMNVPYLLPAFTWWPEDQFFEVLTGADGAKLALFRPREWRGVDSDTDQYRLTPQRMADELGGYPKGTVTWVYMTSDGGLTLQNSFLTLAKLLPPHVRLVSTDAAARLAIAAK